MNSSSTKHVPVLKNEVIKHLNPCIGGWIVDATLGTGGHSKLILQKIGKTGLLIGIDQDDRNLALAKENLREYSNVIFVRDNFENLEEIVEEVRALKKESKPISGILFDLGVSSVHLDDASRGFSFQKDGPLDMRFDLRKKITAAEIINKWRIKDLIKIFKIYGEEHFSKRIAEAIGKQRKLAPFSTTKELADFISKIICKRGKIHPATRIFQALRIAVNNELQVLQKGLASAINLIGPGGRIVAISFHSLEDRIIKNTFKAYSQSETPPIFKILTKKPVIAGEQEIEENPRSRSAKLRAVERIS